GRVLLASVIVAAALALKHVRQHPCVAVFERNRGMNRLVQTAVFRLVAAIGVQVAGIETFGAHLGCSLHRVAMLLPRKWSLGESESEGPKYNGAAGGEP